MNSSPSSHLLYKIIARPWVYLGGFPGSNHKEMKSIPVVL